jgi:hypothetical protein
LDKSSNSTKWSSTNFDNILDQIQPWLEHIPIIGAKNITVSGYTPLLYLRRAVVTSCLLLTVMMVSVH